MRRITDYLGRITLTVVFLTLAALLAPGAAQAAPASQAAGRVPAASPIESSFTSSLNAERTRRGLPRLAVRSALVVVARQQAARMASRSVLYHNPRLTTQVHNWRWVGENVGYGPEARTVHAAFMASPRHRDNILDRDYTEVGIGTVVRGGRVWVVQVFRQPLRTQSFQRGTVVQRPWLQTLLAAG